MMRRKVRRSVRPKRLKYEMAEKQDQEVSQRQTGLLARRQRTHDQEDAIERAR